MAAVQFSYSSTLVCSVVGELSSTNYVVYSKFHHQVLIKPDPAAEPVFEASWLSFVLILRNSNFEVLI